MMNDCLIMQRISLQIRIFIYHLLFIFAHILIYFGEEVTEARRSEERKKKSNNI